MIYDLSLRPKIPDTDLVCEMCRSNEAYLIETGEVSFLIAAGLSSKKREEETSDLGAECDIIVKEGIGSVLVLSNVFSESCV